MNRRRNIPILWGWLTLIQLLSILVSAGILILTFDPFGGDGGMVVFGVLFLFVWALWGYFLPRRVRPSGIQIAIAAGVWSALLLALWLLLERHTILFHLPQMLTGKWLAQLWPGSYYNVWYQQTLEPAMVCAAHFILSAAPALGIFLRNREEAVRSEGK